MRHKELPALIALGLLALPSYLVLLFASGFSTGTVFIGVLIALAALGHVILASTMAPLLPEDRTLLSLPTGYLVTCAFFALGARSGIGTIALFWTLGLAAAASLVWIVLRKEYLVHARLHDGGWLLLLSAIVTLIFFLPGAVRDGVFHADGSYSWMYADTQIYSAIAASVKSSIGMPRAPDMGVIDLRYHFGPHALAGALSAVLDIPVGDAVARVVRPSALLALLCASYALGTMLSRGGNRRTSGGVLAASSLFLYGSVGALFSNNVNSSSSVSGAMLFELPMIGVQSSGGLFAHLIIGGSMVHGLTGLFVALFLLVSILGTGGGRYPRTDLMLFLPAVVLPSSLLAGIATTGLTIALLVWFRPREKWTWVDAATVLFVATISAWGMGYFGSLLASRTWFSSWHALAEDLPELVVWVFVGLGARLYALSRIDPRLRDPASASLVVSLLGFLSFRVLLTDEYGGDTRYGLVFAQATLSVFAFAWLSHAVAAAVRGDWSEMQEAVGRVLRVVVACATLLFVIAVILRISVGTSGRHSSTLVGVSVLASGMCLIAGSVGMLVFARMPRLRQFVTMFVVVIYSAGFLAWVPDWVNFGLDRMQMDINISTGEVAGLAKLKSISVRGDLVATNRHALNIDRYQTNRSCSYGALSERAMLLEGWQCLAAVNHPQFEQVKEANDTLFSTRDEAIAKAIVDQYKIRFIVAMPGTDVALSAEKPRWLVKVPESGSLNVYQVVY